MAQSKLTLIGLYNWDANLFKNLYLPTGIDKDIAITTILIESCEFEVIYSDPNFIEDMIGLISKKWQRTFQKWHDALQLEYNPIENYDRYEEWTDEGTNTGTVKHGTTKNSASKGSELYKASKSEDISISNSQNIEGSTSESLEGSNTENVTGSNTESVNDSRNENIKGTSTEQSSGTSQTDTFVSSYDSNSLNQDNQSKSSQSANSSGSTSQDTTGSSKQDTTRSSKQDTTGSSSQSTTGSSKQDTTGSSSQSTTISDQSSTDTSGSVSEIGSDDETRNLGSTGEHEGHVHGNIGVTTSQQMLKAELDISSWNLYQHIADIFVEELCIMVY